MGTKDIVLISEHSEQDFVRKLFEAVQTIERKELTCEIKFSTVEDRLDRIVFSALIHAYE